MTTLRSMDNWWSNLAFPLQFFYAIGSLAAILLIFQAALTFLGADHHDMPDADHPDGLGVLSQKSVTGFFFGFGWTGVLGLRNGLGLPLTLLLALLVGSGFLLTIYFLMRTLYGMRSSGTLDYANAIGETASVYVTIPAAMQAGGQVEVMIQGRLQTISGMTRSQTPLLPGSKVKVIGQIDRGTLEVAPISSPHTNPNNT